MKTRMKIMALNKLEVIIFELCNKRQKVDKMTKSLLKKAFKAKTMTVMEMQRGLLSS